MEPHVNGLSAELRALRLCTGSVWVVAVCFAEGGGRGVRPAAQ